MCEEGYHLCENQKQDTQGWSPLCRGMQIASHAEIGNGRCRGNSMNWRGCR